MRRPCCRSSRSTSSIARDVRRSGRVIPAATRCGEQPPQHQRLGVVQHHRAREHAADGEVDLRQHQGHRHQGRRLRRKRQRRRPDRRQRRASALAKSVSGNVEVADTQIDGTLEAGSVSGDVILRRLTARRIDTSSISGTVEVGGRPVRSHRRAVDQRRRGLFRPAGQGGRYALKSHSGEVTVAIAGEHRVSNSTPRRSPARFIRTSRSPRMGPIRDGASGRSRAATATAAPSSISRHSAETSSLRSARARRTSPSSGTGLADPVNRAGRSVASRCKLILTSGRGDETGGSQVSLWRRR